MSNGVRIYSVEAFQAGFVMIVAWSMLSCLLIAVDPRDALPAGRPRAIRYGHG